MIQKNIKSRIVNKHAIESDWIKATNFVPLQGELVIYDIEIDADGNTLTLPEGRTTPYNYERFKIGDGVTNVNELPFALETASGGGIVTVDTLPTEGATDTIYKVYEVDDLKPIGFDENNTPIITPTEENVHIKFVNELPEVGTPAVDVADNLYMYYLKTDGKLYIYVTSELAEIFGGEVPEGWNEAEIMLGEIIFVNSLEEAVYNETSEISYILLVKKPHLYFYDTNTNAYEQLITESELDSRGYLTEHQTIKTINGESLVGEGDITISAGADGYTPVRGTDYWTEADKAEIKAYVDEAILGGSW